MKKKKVEIKNNHKIITINIYEDFDNDKAYNTYRYEVIQDYKISPIIVSDIVNEMNTYFLQHPTQLKLL